MRRGWDEQSAGPAGRRRFSPAATPPPRLSRDAWQHPRPPSTLQGCLHSFPGGRRSRTGHLFRGVAGAGAGTACLPACGCALPLLISPPVCTSLAQPCRAAGQPTHLPLQPKASWQAGADVIELGVPSVQAAADGPTIQAADARALAAGAGLEQAGDEGGGAGVPCNRCPVAADSQPITCRWPGAQVLALVRRASARLRAPLLLFLYAAQLLAAGGPDAFCRLAGEAGAAGGRAARVVHQQGC